MEEEIEERLQEKYEHIFGMFVCYLYSSVIQWKK